LSIRRDTCTTGYPRSGSKCCIQTILSAAVHGTTYSAAVVDLATSSCSNERHGIMSPWEKTMKPATLHDVSGSSAWFASVYSIVTPMKTLILHKRRTQRLSDIQWTLSVTCPYYTPILNTTHRCVGLYGFEIFKHPLQHQC
jgi:hypothetical protein